MEDPSFTTTTLNRPEVIQGTSNNKKTLNSRLEKAFPCDNVSKHPQGLACEDNFCRRDY